MKTVKAVKYAPGERIKAGDVVIEGGKPGEYVPAKVAKKLHAALRDMLATSRQITGGVVSKAKERAEMNASAALAEADGTAT